MAPSNYTTTLEYTIAQTVLTILADIVVVILSLFHCYYYYKNEISKTKDVGTNHKSTFQAVMSKLTLITVILYTLSLLDGTVGYFKCSQLIYRLAPAFYLPAKGCMFIIFIMRLHFVYSKSIYAFNKTVLQISAIIVIILHLGLPIYAYMDPENTIYQREFDMFGYHIFICQRSFGLIFMVSVLSLDVICSIVTLFSFICPLIKILNSLKENYHQNYKNEDLTYPIIKVSILTIIATTTSLATVTISMSTLTNVSYSFDVPLNCLCVMLMTPYYPKLYEKLCCGLIKCISYCDEKSGIEKNIKQHIGNNENAKIDDNRSVNLGDTRFDTTTLGIEPNEIIYENEMEMTETVKK